MNKVAFMLYRRWRQFWFEPAPPFNLGFCRLLIYGALFFFYMQTDFSPWVEINAVFWKPIWLFSHFHIPVISGKYMAGAQLIWKIALLTSCIGLLTRLSTLTSFVLGLYFLGLPHNFGKTNHSDAIIVFILGIMAVSRCGDGLSMDGLLTRFRKRNDQSADNPGISGEYMWPIRMVWLVMALIFFAAGVSKIGRSGLEWITSNNMSILLVQTYFQGSALVSWGTYLAQIKWLSGLLAAFIIFIETGFPLALFSRRMRLIFVPGAFLMQIGIKILMGIGFSRFIICYIFWVPWDRVSPAVRFGTVVGIIALLKSDWIIEFAHMVGVECNTELLVYLGLAGLALFCLIYYTVQKTSNSRYKH